MSSLSKEDLKLESTALNEPSKAGWNIDVQCETTPDGRGHFTETKMSTSGVEEVDGGLSRFQGYDTQRSSSRHEGDDRNFVKEATESSLTHLEENIERGDETTGRSQIHRSLKSSSSSSSKRVMSSSVMNDRPEPITIVDQPMNRNLEQEFQQQHQQVQRQQQQQQQQQRFEHCERVNRAEEMHQSSAMNVSSEQTTHQKYIDMDKASPEYQNYVQHLMNQPGEIVSNTVEYPKPNVRMITTVKRLPDGTIVRNKRYETEASESHTHQDNLSERRSSFSSTISNASERHRSRQEQQLQSDGTDNTSTRNLQREALREERENEYTERRTVQEQHYTKNIEEQRFNEEKRHSISRNQSKDFTTHGFPSVRKTEEPIRPTVPEERKNQHHLEKVEQTKGEEKTFSEQKITNCKQQQETEVDHDQQQRTVERTSKHYRTIHDEESTQQQHYDQNVRDFSTHGYPSVKPTPAEGGRADPRPTTTTTRDSVTPQRETVVDNLRKTEVDASHRAFAASLRNSPQRETTSPLKNLTRECSPESSTNISEGSRKQNIYNNRNTVRSENRSSKTLDKSSEYLETRRSPEKSFPVGNDRQRCFTPRKHHLTSKTQMHDKGQRSLQPHIPIDSYTNKSHNRDSKNTFHNNRNCTPSKPPRKLEPKIMNSSTIKPLSSISDKSSTSPPLEEVIEEPFIKKYYYKLGPRDPPLPSSSSASARTEYDDKKSRLSTPVAVEEQPEVDHSTETEANHARPLPKSGDLGMTTDEEQVDYALFQKLTQKKKNQSAVIAPGKKSEPRNDLGKRSSSPQKSTPSTSTNKTSATPTNKSNSIPTNNDCGGTKPRRLLYREAVESLLMDTPKSKKPTKEPTVKSTDEPKPLSKEEEVFTAINSKQLREEYNELNKITQDLIFREMQEMEDNQIEENTEQTGVTNKQKVPRKLPEKGEVPNDKEKAKEKKESVENQEINQSVKTRKTSLSFEEQQDRVEKIDRSVEDHKIEKSQKEESIAGEKTQTICYEKKGTKPRETFEQRCRQMLGMEDYSSTNGSYRHVTETDHNAAPVRRRSSLRNERYLKDLHKEKDVKVEEKSGNSDIVEEINSLNHKNENLREELEKEEMVEINNQKISNDESDIEEAEIEIERKFSTGVNSRGYLERRRSSATMPNTEVIIDHEIPKTTRKSRDFSSGRRSSAANTTTTKNTSDVKREHESKMSRSVSENVTKSTPLRATDATSKRPGSLQKERKESNGTSSSRVPSERRPRKCLSAKTINLATNNLLHDTDDADTTAMLIDTQQAKSSREPSPNKLIPTPVPDDLDTGKPRFPDFVQEPDEETNSPAAGRKPVVNNIPIFEEATKSFVGCQISEVNEIHDQMSHSQYDEEQYESHEDVVSEDSSSEMEESPAESHGKPIRLCSVNDMENDNDECLLTVQEKVSKFTNSIEEVTKPKSSLNETIAATAPQKSPQLVRHISKSMLAKFEQKPQENNEEIGNRIGKTDLNCQDKTTRNEDKYTSKTSLRELNRQSDILSRASVFERDIVLRGSARRPPNGTNRSTTSTTSTEQIEQINNAPNSINSNLDDSVTVTHCKIKSQAPFAPTRAQSVTTTKVSRVQQTHSIPTNNGIIPDDKLSMARKLSRSSEKAAAPGNSSQQFNRDLVNKNSVLVGKSRSSMDVEQPSAGKDRRPSYMDHTRSSLEHTRRESSSKTVTQQLEDDDEYDYGRSSNTKTTKTVVLNGDDISLKYENGEMSKCDLDATEWNENSIIEEIFDINVLEQMLETVKIYELRRRIRAQIRKIKSKPMEKVKPSTGRTNSATQKSTVSNRVPVKNERPKDGKTTVKPVKPVSRRESSKEVTTSSNRKDSREMGGLNTTKLTSSTMSSTKTSSTKTTRSGSNSGTTAVASPRSSKNVTPMENGVNSTIKRMGFKGTERATTTTTTTTTTSTGNRLNEKKSNTSATTTRSSFRTVPSKVTETKSRLKSQPSQTKNSKEVYQDDVVTSSYGIGPTDENGLPLFGLKALKKGHSSNSSKSDATTTKESIIVDEANSFEDFLANITKNKDELKAFQQRRMEEVFQSNNRDQMQSYSTHKKTTRTFTNEMDNEGMSSSYTLDIKEGNNEHDLENVKHVTNTYHTNFRSPGAIREGLQKLAAVKKEFLSEHETNEQQQQQQQTSQHVTQSLLGESSECSLTAISPIQTSRKEEVSSSSSRIVLGEISDETVLRKLLDEAETYEERRKIRERIRKLMAENKELMNLLEFN